MGRKRPLLDRRVMEDLGSLLNRGALVTQVLNDGSVGWRATPAMGLLDGFGLGGGDVAPLGNLPKT